MSVVASKLVTWMAGNYGGTECSLSEQPGILPCNDSWIVSRVCWVLKCLSARSWWQEAIAGYLQVHFCPCVDDSNRLVDYFPIQNPPNGKLEVENVGSLERIVGRIDEEATLHDWLSSILLARKMQVAPNNCSFPIGKSSCASINLSYMS